MRLIELLEKISLNQKINIISNNGLITCKDERFLDTKYFDYKVSSIFPTIENKNTTVLNIKIYK